MRSALRNELIYPFKVCIGARELTHDAAARKNDDFVRDVQRLLQIVLNQNDRLASVASAADLIEHLLGLTDRESSSRLVEDQAARPINDGAGGSRRLASARRTTSRLGRLGAVADQRRAWPAAAYDVR